MSVVIPVGVTARNEAGNIVGCLRCLRVAAARATEALGCTYVLHVLLNDNDDETPALLAGTPDVTVWQTHGGLVEAQRTLVEHSGESAPFLVFSDADIAVNPDALLEISRAMLDDPALEVAYAEKRPLPPVRRSPLARALYLYNLHEGYQTRRHYCNGQFFAIRRWHIPRPEELRWDPRLNTPFLNLKAGIRADDIYLSREILSRAGPEAIRCLPAGLRYRPPETLRGMFRRYQRMRLELERLDALCPELRPAQVQWGRRRTEGSRLAVAPRREKMYYGLFQAALLLCRIAYRLQRWYYTHLSSEPCPTWLPVRETKVAILEDA